MEQTNEAKNPFVEAQAESQVRREEAEVERIEERTNLANFFSYQTNYRGTAIA